MEIVISKVETYPIKNGWAAYSPQLCLTNHGPTPEAAMSNLERGIKIFLEPFQCNSELKNALMRMKLTTVPNGGDEITVRLSLPDVGSSIHRSAEFIHSRPNAK